MYDIEVFEVGDIVMVKEGAFPECLAFINNEIGIISKKEGRHSYLVMILNHASGYADGLFFILGHRLSRVKDSEVK